jgi:hypothetical protein
MKSDEGSFFSRISSWFRSGSNQQKDHSQELERLRSEQARLSLELETVLSSYDDRTKLLASRLVSAESPLTDAELQRAYEEQLFLWNIVRRLQAGERSVPELEQEYIDWNERRDQALPEFHPDHPNVRLELISSELRSRGRGIPTKVSTDSYEGSAKDADPFADLNLDDASVDIEPPVESNNDSLNQIRTIAMNPEMSGILMDQIRECGHQLRKQSSHPKSTPQDLADLYTELRHHHAHLRRIDRKTGTRRYRVVLHQL